MKVCGFSRVTRFSPSRPSATRPWKRAFQGEKPWSAAIRSSAMKPMLCRLPAYFAPGLPSPTINSIGNSFVFDPSLAVDLARN